MRKIIKYAFINAFGTALYVIVVASFIYFIGQSALKDLETVFAPIAMLMLLVFSVALVGSLIFGRSAVWYIDGRKKDSFLLLAYTLGIFLLITVVVFGLMVIQGNWIPCISRMLKVAFLMIVKNWKFLRL